MTEKKIGNLTVNDGKGLYDNDGICDSLIQNLNRLPKLLIDGQYIQFCAVICEMGQKLLNLKKGIKADMDSMSGKVEELKKMNDSLMEQITGLPVNKESAENGKD